MPKEATMAYALAPRIARAVKNSGLEVVWVGDWDSRGRAKMRDVQTITIHHTATPRSFKKSTEYPTFNVVKNGRPGIPGPLSQLGLGRTGVVYVFAAGVANHAGKSRSTSMTNSYAIGIEAEGAMEDWPPAQYEAYLKLVRALLDEFDLPESRALRHAETCSPPGRKNDASFNGNTFRTRLKSTRLGGKPSTPKPTTPPPAQKKGILDMSFKTSDRRTAKQPLPPNRETTLKTRAKNTWSFLASTKRGETFAVNTHLTINGLREGQVAEVWLRLGEYNSKTKKGATRYDYKRVTVHGRAGGGDVHAELTQFDKCNIGPKMGGDMRLYVIAKNVSGGGDVAVTDIKWTELTD